MTNLAVPPDGSREQQFKGAIRKLYNQTGDQADSLKGEFEAFASKALTIFELLEKDLHGHDSDWALDAERARRLRKDERDDKWVAWRHGIARWVLSSVLALALYSGAVTLAEHWAFVHVPVHDWFAKPHDH